MADLDLEELIRRRAGRSSGLSTSTRLREPVLENPRRGAADEDLADARARAAAARAARLAEAREARERLPRDRAEPADTTAPLPGENLLLPVDASVPLLLLPIRLETRFAGTAPDRELLVRIYPDDLHVDTHEPALTVEENTAGRLYWEQMWTGDAAADKIAWKALAGKFGAQRAAWVARALTPTNLATRPASPPKFPLVDERDSSWSRAPRSTTLPDNWIALGYVGATRVVALAGNPIPAVLQVGPAPEADDLEPESPSPNAAMPLDEGMRWLIDFDAAVKIGMAMRIPLPAAAQEGLTRLLVIGVKNTQDAGASASTLTEQLDAHHYTRGIAFIPPGTPTNNTGELLSGLDSRDNGNERSFSIEREGVKLDPNASDGSAAARALGVEPDVFAHVDHAADQALDLARAMNTTLWPATWGYYLQQRLAGAISDDELQLVRRHFTTFVRGGAPLPSLRIGRQPYGILPVTSLDRWQPLDPGDLNGKALTTLREIREAFRRALPGIPRLGNADKIDEQLVAVLCMCPLSKSHEVRQVLGPLFVSNVFAFAGASLSQMWWQAHRDTVVPTTIGGITPTTPQAVATLSPTTEAVSGAPRVKSDDTPDYLEPLASAGYRAVRDHELLPTKPQPMLYLLARHALLLSYATAGNRIARRGGTLVGASELDPEFIRIDSNVTTETIWERLDKPVPTITGPQKLGAFLDGAAHERNEDVLELAELRASLRKLAPAPTSDLERLMTETLDLASHRFDAWVTSLAARRLEGLRAKQPKGLRLGGFGWLEEIRPAGSVVSNGFIQVPSLEHAATAAVLASGYLSHRKDSGPSPFEIDLSSNRVRTARWLLQGVRAGQTLGALLGYRIDRGLHEAKLARHLDTIRGVYPLPPGIDGLALLDQRRTMSGKFPALRARLQTDLGTRFADADFVLRKIDQELDALGDLLISEGVFQATRGSFERAGQTLGSVVDGAPLPEPEVMDTPRTGVLLTHRVLTLLSAKKPPASVEATTPRARAEPRVNAWAAQWLGSLAKVRCRMQYSAGDKVVVHDLRIADLNWAPLDWLATPIEQLEAMLLTRAQAHPPAGLPAASHVTWVPGRDSKWKADLIAWEEFKLLLGAARDLMTAMRAALPGDLAPADQPPNASIDLTELRKRADVAVKALQVAGTSAEPETVLPQFGIFSAARESAVKEATTRLAAVAALAASFNRDGANPERQVAHDRERIRLVFGSTFPVAALFTLDESNQLARSFTETEQLQGGNTLEAATWLDRIGRVRTAAGKLAEAARLASVLNGDEPPCCVAQLPFEPGDRWIALPAEPGTIHAGKVAFVVTGEVPDLKTAVAGLVIDDWTELVPNARETTGLAFQFDRPGSRPPQAMLLAVSPDPTRPWDLATLEATLLETLELAQLRLVDQQALAEFDQYLPALCFALNAANDTISTDFR